MLKTRLNIGWLRGVNNMELDLCSRHPWHHRQALCPASPLWPVHCTYTSPSSVLNSSLVILPGWSNICSPPGRSPESVSDWGESKDKQEGARNEKMARMYASSHTPHSKVLLLWMNFTGSPFGLYWLYLAFPADWICELNVQAILKPSQSSPRAVSSHFGGWLPQRPWCFWQYGLGSGRISCPRAGIKATTAALPVFYWHTFWRLNAFSWGSILWGKVLMKNKNKLPMAFHRFDGGWLQIQDLLFGQWL